MKDLFGRFLRGFWGPAVLAAALLWAAFAPLDWGFAPATLAWAVLFASMRLRDGHNAGKQLLVAHLLFYAASLWWISPLILPGYVVTVLYCAAFEALFGRVLRPLWLRTRLMNGIAWIVIAPLAHLFFDMGRTVLFTGFPWHIVGYAGWRLPALVGGGGLMGVHGATLAILFLAAALAELYVRWVEERAHAWKIWVPAAVAWGALAAVPLVGAVKAAPRRLDLLILQASIAQELKNDRDESGAAPPTLEEWWRIHERLADEGLAKAGPDGVDAVVWPETMLPNHVRRPFPVSGPAHALTKEGLSTAPVTRAAAMARSHPTIAGVPTFDATGAKTEDDVRKWNTAVLLAPDGRVVASQDKRHLTPGGEYIPLLRQLPFRAALETWLRDNAGFLPDLLSGEGVELLPLRSSRDEWTAKVGVTICYESLFPQLARDLSRAGADVLLNVSNYGWFAGTSEMDQALAHAAFRAAENGRPFVLASNNGICATFDRWGRLLERTEADVPAAFVCQVDAGSNAGTLFMATGEWSAWALGAGGLVCVLVLRRRQARREEDAKSGETS